MNILFINFFLNLWFLRYRECPYSGTVRIRLLYTTSSSTIIRNVKDIRYIYICIII